MKKQAWLLGGMIAVGMTTTATGQYLSGLVNSNYAGTHALYQHPSAAADSRYALYLNLAAVDVGFSNTYVRWSAPYSLPRLLTNSVPNRYRGERGGVLWSKDYLREQLNGRDKRLTANSEVRGPSALVTLNDRFGVALLTRARFGASFRRTSEEIARLLRSGTQIRELQNVESDNQTGFFNANSFAELGAAVGMVLYEDDEQLWKGGLTVKRLFGFYNSHIQVDDGAHAIVRDRQQPGFQALSIRNFDGTLGYTSQEAVQALTPAGGGWGLDLGVTYEYRTDTRRYRYREMGEMRTDPSKNKYLYRISVSLVDIGRMRYRNPAYVNQYPVAAQNKLITNRTFRGLKGHDVYAERVVDLLDLPAETRKTDFRSALPTALNISVDYRVQERVYVSGMLVQSLRSGADIGMVTPSMVAVVPRWESRWAEVSMPVTLQDNYSMLTIGLAARLGPVFVGTDHLGGLLNIGNPRGAGFYAGAAVPLFRSGPKNPNKCFYQQPERNGFWRRRR